MADQVVENIEILNDPFEEQNKRIDAAKNTVKIFGLLSASYSGFAISAVSFPVSILSTLAVGVFVPYLFAIPAFCFLLTISWCFLAALNEKNQKSARGVADAYLCADYGILKNVNKPNKKDVLHENIKCKN